MRQFFNREFTPAKAGRKVKMNKAEFIEALDNRIAVLTEEERQDILDEYEQHIDMKTMRGMTEEAAIADFGKIEELAADILEAYHVRIDYAPADQRRRMRHRADKEQYAKTNVAAAGTDRGEAEGASRSRMEEGASVFGHIYEEIWGKTKSFCTKIYGYVRRAAHASGQGLHKAKECIWAGMAGFIHVCTSPFRGNGEKVPEGACGQWLPGDEDTEGTEKMKKKERFFPGRILGKIFGACVDAIRFCAKWTWNLFWGGLGILFGAASCFVIFMMGMLAVLLALGYPLLGVSIGWLGLVLCVVSVTVWCFSLMITKRKERVKCGRRYDKRAGLRSHTRDRERGFVCREKEANITGAAGMGKALPEDVEETQAVLQKEGEGTFMQRETGEGEILLTEIEKEKEERFDA